MALAEVLVILSVLLGCSSVHAADLPAARLLFDAGDYDACAAEAEKTIAEGYHGEDWPLLKISCDIERGRYASALQTLEGALKNFRFSVRLRYLGCDVLRFNGQVDRADELNEEIAALATRSTYRYGDAANRVVLGKYFLHAVPTHVRYWKPFSIRQRRTSPSRPTLFWRLASWHWTRVISRWPPRNLKVL